MTAAQFLIPACPVPVAAQIGGQFGDDHQMTLADPYPPVTAGADVALAGRIRLDGGDDLYAEEFAHGTRATATGTVPVVMETSTIVVRCLRKGLKPTEAW